MIPINEKAIPLIAAALGAIIGTTNALIGWVDRYSARKRQEQAARHASLLFRLLGDIGQGEQVGVASHVIGPLRSKVRLELDSTLHNLSDALDQGALVAPARPLTRTQRIFLWFKPAGWNAWIAHLLFYSSILMVGDMLFGSLSHDSGDISYAAMSQNWHDPEMLGALVLYGALAFISYRWAVAERKLRKFDQKPKPSKETTYGGTRMIATIAFICYVTLASLGLFLPFTGYPGPPHIFWLKRGVAFFTAGVSYAWMRSCMIPRKKHNWRRPRRLWQWLAVACLTVNGMWSLIVSLHPGLLVVTQGPNAASTTERIFAGIIFSAVPLLCCIQFAELQLASTAFHEKPVGHSTAASVS